MGNLFDDLRNLLLSAIGLGAIVVTQSGCGLIVIDELSDTRGGKVLASAQFGGDGDQRVQGAVVDNERRIVLTGTTNGTNFCGEAVGGAIDMFVVWLDPTSTPFEVPCSASRLFGGTGNDEPFGIAADPTGTIGIIGRSDDAIDFTNKGSPLPYGGGNDVVVAKLTNMDCSWQASFGAMDAQEGRAIAFDSDGSAYVGGRFKGMMALHDPFTSMGGFDPFISKLEPNDVTPKYDRVASVPSDLSDQEVHRLAIDNSGNIIVSGSFHEAIDFGCPSLLGGNGIFLASLPGGVGCNWQIRIAEGTPSDLEPMSLAVAPDGGIVVAGGFRQMQLFPDQGNCALDATAGMDEDVFVAKLNSSGMCLWRKTFGEVELTTSEIQEIQRAYAIAFDSSSNVYVAGEFRKSIRFDSEHEYHSHGFEDTFVAKLNGVDGHHEWSKAIGGDGVDRANAIVMDPDGQFVVVSGSFGGTLNADSGLTLSGDNSDIFVAKLTP